MKKIILILLVLVFASLFSDEWIQVDGRDFKLVKIYPELNIVVADGEYDIVIENDEIISMTNIGNLGAYFYYDGEKKNVTLTQEMIDSLIVQTYGEPEEEE